VPQHALGIFINRTQNRLLPTIDGDPIGALGGAQHAHGNADDRDNDDDANGNKQTDARLVPPRLVRFPGGLYLRRRQHIATF
jgi:hypothetical protein